MHFDYFIGIFLWMLWMWPRRFSYIPQIIESYRPLAGFKDTHSKTCIFNIAYLKCCCNSFVIYVERSKNSHIRSRANVKARGKYARFSHSATPCPSSYRNDFETSREVNAIAPSLKRILLLYIAIWSFYTYVDPRQHPDF